MTIKIEKEEIVPVCPYCEAALQKLIEVKRGWFSVNKVFCCPHCHKIIGIAAGQ